MNRKKKEKLNFSDLAPLSQNPFAALGQQLGVIPEATAGTAKPGPSEKKRSLLNIRLEKRKKGHNATCIYNLADEGAEMLKKLKTRLGTGGTVGESAIELQGDHREACRAFLEKEGFKVRVL